MLVKGAIGRKGTKHYSISFYQTGKPIPGKHTGEHITLSLNLCLFMTRKCVIAMIHVRPRAIVQISTLLFYIPFKMKNGMPGAGLTAKSREVSKPRDWMLQWSYRSEIWQAPRQQRCRGTCQISERLEMFKPESRGFETSRDLAVRRLTA